MFSGLIQEIDCITIINRQSCTIKLTCKASKQILTDYEMGDRLAINGVCVTSIEKSDTSFTVDIMPETYQRTTVYILKSGSEIKLECAMSLIKRVEGHLLRKWCSIDKFNFVYISQLQNMFRN